MNAPLSDNDEVRRLFIEHVPEVASGAIVIKGIARMAGRHAIVVVHASDASVDAVGECVGRRGSHVKAVVRALPGERVDIVLWSESLRGYIQNLIGPAKIEHLAFDTAAHRATLTVSGDASSLTRDGGMRLQLVSRLVGWDLELIET